MILYLVDHCAPLITAVACHLGAHPTTKPLRAVGHGWETGPVGRSCRTGNGCAREGRWSIPPPTLADCKTHCDDWEACNTIYYSATGGCFVCVSCATTDPNPGFSILLKVTGAPTRPGQIAPPTRRPARPGRRPTNVNRPPSAPPASSLLPSPRPTPTPTNRPPPPATLAPSPPPTTTNPTSAECSCIDEPAPCRHHVTGLCFQYINGTSDCEVGLTECRSGVPAATTSTAVISEGDCSCSAGAGPCRHPSGLCLPHIDGGGCQAGLTDCSGGSTATAIAADATPEPTTGSMEPTVHPTVGTPNCTCIAGVGEPCHEPSVGICLPYLSGTSNCESGLIDCGGVEDAAATTATTHIATATTATHNSTYTTHAPAAAPTTLPAVVTDCTCSTSDGGACQHSSGVCLPHVNGGCEVGLTDCSGGSTATTIAAATTEPTPDPTTVDVDRAGCADACTAGSGPCRHSTGLCFSYISGTSYCEVGGELTDCGEIETINPSPSTSPPTFPEMETITPSPSTPTPTTSPRADQPSAPPTPAPAGLASAVSDTGTERSTTDDSPDAAVFVAWTFFVLFLVLGVVTGVFFYRRQQATALFKDNPAVLAPRYGRQDRPNPAFVGGGTCGPGVGMQYAGGRPNSTTDC